MENDYLYIILTAICSGSLGWLVNWRSNKEKNKAEAAMTTEQAWQQKIDGERRYSAELLQDRETLAKENREFRTEIRDANKRLDSMEERQNKLERVIHELQPYVCTVVNCPNRIFKYFKIKDDEQPEAKTEP